MPVTEKTGIKIGRFTDRGFTVKQAGSETQLCGMQGDPCQHRTGEQLPETGLRRKEIGDGIGMVKIQIQPERNENENERDDKKIETLFPCQPQQQWPDDVKLLLDTETPEMQKRFGLRRIVEITAFEPEQKVGNESCATGDMLAELGIFMIEKEKKTLKKIVDERKTKPENETSEQNRYQNRVNPPDPPAVKIPETESIAFELAENDRGNQKTGNDEKISTPTKPPRMTFGKAWKMKTAKTASARNPSISGR